MPGGRRNAARESCMQPEKTGEVDLLRGTLAAGGVGKTVDLRIDFLAQIFPDVIRHTHESCNHFRIKLATRPFFDLFTSGRQWLRGAIRAIRHNGIQSVGHGKHSGAKRNLIAFQSARVACAIKAFLMGVYNVASFLQEGNLLEHLVAAIAVLSHDSYFFGIQSARLAQDGIGNSHLSNVMEKGAAGNYPDVIVGKSHGAGNSDGKGGYSFGVY